MQAHTRAQQAGIKNQDLWLSHYHRSRGLLGECKLCGATSAEASDMQAHTRRGNAGADTGKAQPPLNTVQSRSKSRPVPSAQRAFR